MSKFTKYYKDVDKFTKITMRGGKTMHGVHKPAKEVRLNAPHTKAHFRKARINVQRDYFFPVRRMSQRQKSVVFRKKSLQVPRGVNFGKSGLITAIYEQYGKSNREFVRKKTKESRLKKEAGDRSIRAQEEARDALRNKTRSGRRQYTRNKPSKPKKQEPPVPPPPKDEESWWVDEDEPVEVKPIEEEVVKWDPEPEPVHQTFKAQCYNCYGLMDVPVSAPPILLSCPSCGVQNQFSEVPEDAVEKTAKKTDYSFKTLHENEKHSERTDGQGTWDPEAKAMFDNGVRLLNEGFYKGALYWFEQALEKDPSFRDAYNNWKYTKEQLGED